MPNEIYEWENLIYPQYQKIFIKKKEQKQLLEALSTHFKLPIPQLVQNKKKNCLGWYTSPGYDVPPIIALYRPSTLGTLCHEFAHHLSWFRYCNIKHGRCFVECLKEVYEVIDGLRK